MPSLACKCTMTRLLLLSQGQRLSVAASGTARKLLANCMGVSSLPGAPVTADIAMSSCAHRSVLEIASRKWQTVPGCCCHLWYAGALCADAAPLRCWVGLELAQGTDGGEEQLEEGSGQPLLSSILWSVCVQGHDLRPSKRLRSSVLLSRACRGRDHATLHARR